MIHSFTLLSAPELQSLPPDLTLFLFPVGGLEQHGTHLPMGTKVIQCREWAESFAKKLDAEFPQWNFILMPVLPFTVDPYTSQYSLSVRPHVMRDALVDQCESLKKMGFKQFAAFSSHLSPKQLATIEDAAKIVSNRKSYLVSLSSAMVDSKQVWKSPMVPLPEEHAGAFDTGWLLSSNPKLVHESATSLPMIEAPRASAARFVQYFSGKLDGYWGNPGAARAELAQEKMGREFDLLIEKIRPMMTQGKGQGSFSSGYRSFPLNGSFFKAYLLALIFFVCMLLWVLWGFKDVFES